MPSTWSRTTGEDFLVRGFERFVGLDCLLGRLRLTVIRGAAVRRRVDEEGVVFEVEVLRRRVTRRRLEELELFEALE